MPASADRLFAVSVRVNGQEDSDFYKCIQSVRVDEDIRQGSSFEIVVSLCRNDDGSWPHVDTDSLKPWNRVTIRVTVGEVTDVVMDGYISDVHIATTQATASLQANFAGVDASYIMNLEPHCKVWREQTYEEIAEAIIKQNHLTPVLAPEQPGTGAPPPSVTQRQTDLNFLRQLARRRGYEFYVRGAQAYFRPPDLESTPQKLIAANFGEQTNCEDLQISVDGTQATEAVVGRQDPVSGEAQAGRATAADSTGKPLGTTGVDSFTGYGVPQRRLLPRRMVGSFNDADLDGHVQAVMMHEAFWLKARGALNGLRYGSILRAGKPVTIKGFGDLYAGIYYVRKVVHQLTPRTYQLQFEAYRNRVGKTGTENFDGEDPSDTAAPPALGPGAGDLTTVREDGNRVMA
jgi:phage protein D